MQPSQAAETLDQFVSASLPLLTSLCQQLLSSGTFTVETGGMMKLVAKVYFNLTGSSNLPNAVKEQASFDTWQSMLLQLLALPIPEEAQPSDHEDRLAFPWWKVSIIAHMSVYGNNH